MARHRNRIAVTLSPDALELYEAIADEMHLPLPTFLRQCLENGTPYMRELLKALRESDPQQKLLLAREVQLEMTSDMAKAGRE